MLPAEDDGPLATLLTKAELGEIDRIKSEPATIGLAIFDQDGQVIDLYRLSEEAVAVFSNIFDIVGTLGDDLAEPEPVPSILFESRTFEAVGLPLSAANMVVLKRKRSRGEEGLRNVG